MIFHKNQTKRHGQRGPGGFTLVEAVVALSVLGIGVASTIGALTKFNAYAGTSRNATGAYTVVMNHIDLFQSMSPFNPQKKNDDGTDQIPIRTETVANNPPGWNVSNPANLPTYDMTVGTRTIGYVTKDVNAKNVNVDDKWPVYQYKDPNTGTVVVVRGTLTITVSAVPSLSNTYLGVVSLTYTYLNRNYTYSMSSIRTSDI